jgi:PAS domain S-box-containing protein
MGGIYIITTIESATSTLDNLIKLHQVEILRENLLIHIKRVQSDINLKNTRFASNINTVMINVRNMDKMSDTCFDCHHARDMENKLKELKKDVEEYKHLISRLFTIRANVKRLEKEEDRAFKKGDELVKKVNNMISVASINLEKKTQASLRKIDRTKKVLYFLVSTVPFFAGILGLVFIRGFTNPLKTLMNATRRLEKGDLDYKIEGLTAEFGEVANSFNEMSASLKENMHRIQENEKRYRTLFEGAGDAIFVIDIEGDNIGRIVSANPAAAAMHGYTLDEITKLNLIKDLDSPEAAREAPGRLKRIIEGNWIKAEITHRRKDGTLFPVELSAGLLEFMGHKYILAIDRDISDRKKSEEALLRSYIMFTTVLDSIDAIIYVADIETYKVLYVNKYARDIFGDLEGKTCWKVLQQGQNGPCSFCTNEKLLTPDGRPGGIYKWEYQNTLNSKWYDIRDRAIQWVDGQIVRMEIATDITERKEYEEKLKRAEQMSLVGEWAAGLAHEIKNSLAGIKISVEVLLVDTNISDEDKEIVLKALDEIKRIEALLKSLMTFARPPKLQLTETSINDVLANAVSFSLIKPSITADTFPKIDIVKDFADDLPVMLADNLQLRQVFTNILLNAKESIEKNGTITIKTLYDTGSNTINIEISDTGTGVEKPIVNRIFQPFFTTKSKGSGLGLAITKRIIEEHDGSIEVTNRPGSGALFHISLPVTKHKRSG